jgi:hypothetical protein
VFSKKSDDEKQAAKDLRDLRLAASGIGGFLVRKDPLRFTAVGQMDVPVHGATVTVDHGERAQRITATRVALIGPFALLAKKDTTRLFITIEGTDGAAMLLECPAKKEGAARKFAVLVNAKYGSSTPSSTPTPED